MFLFSVLHQWISHFNLFFNILCRRAWSELFKTAVTKHKYFMVALKAMIYLWLKASGFEILIQAWIAQSAIDNVIIFTLHFRYNLSVHINHRKHFFFTCALWPSLCSFFLQFIFFHLAFLTAGRWEKRKSMFHNSSTDGCRHFMSIERESLTIRFNVFYRLP